MTHGVVDIAERLMAEFDGRMSLDAVTAVARQAAHDVAGVHPLARDEMAERSARQLLLDLS
jgi:hypothetical protein